MTALELLLEALALHGCKPKRSGQQWECLCPAHDDGRPSLSIREGQDGRVLLHCFAGCSALEVCSSIQLRIQDLFPPAGSRVASWRARARRPVHNRRRKAPRAWRRPSTASLHGLWRNCTPLGSDPTVSALVAGRGLDVAGVDWHGGLARSLPKGVAVPSWARCGRHDWASGGWRLVVPLFGASGAMESLHARRFGGQADSPKGVSPAGFQIAGLVMADGPAQALLRKRAWWSDAEPPRVLVVEGVPDFLKAATSVDESDPFAPAVFGVLSGSWTQAIADRLPDGALVTVATHADKAGDRYALGIRETLGRCRTFRVHPEGLEVSAL